MVCVWSGSLRCGTGTDPDRAARHARGFGVGATDGEGRAWASECDAGGVTEDVHSAHVHSLCLAREHGRLDAQDVVLLPSARRGGKDVDGCTVHTTTARRTTNNTRLQQCRGDPQETDQTARHPLRLARVACGVLVRCVAVRPPKTPASKRR